MSENKYKAAIYLRLSKEDNDKLESYSISNQRDLIYDFVKKYDDIEIVDEMVDDGYSGSNFVRPEFQRMLKEITGGRVNCVIVKDLSRFAREYVGSGYYLEKLFPTLGVRFIAINDSVDTISDNGGNSSLIVSFKNILNDSYARDISVKIRSQFEIKRKKGEFIGAFPVFGYVKSKNNKHKLEIDENAAEIVKSIFLWRMDGMSAQAIANKLNLLRVPSPAEYKKRMGFNYSANLKQKSESLWCAQTVIRILKNEIYTGVLAQGKSFTPNHKIKKLIYKAQNEWITVENAHNAIITKDIFNTVSELMKRDTRTAPALDKNYLFSGFLVCADCGQGMVRKAAKTKSGNYSYYVCATNKASLGCSCHSVNENTLHSRIIEVLRFYCRSVVELKEDMFRTDISELGKIKEREIIEAIERNEQNISEQKKALVVVHKLFNGSVSDLEEFMDIKARITNEIKKSESNIEKLQRETIDIKQDSAQNSKWMENFCDNINIEKLTRKLLATLINKIFIYENKQISIEFRHYDKYEKCLRLVKLVNEKQLMAVREAM